MSFYYSNIVSNQEKTFYDAQFSMSSLKQVSPISGSPQRDDSFNISPASSSPDMLVETWKSDEENAKSESPSSQSTTATSTNDDLFASVGTWEVHANENNITVNKKKKRSRKIRRLRDVQDSDEERPKPVIALVPLVPNPFCVSDSLLSKLGPVATKRRRVCFNPTISFHYYCVDK
ncbi:uncharacterized protein CELE_F10G2.4 [Caenorhabditis elegans]|uniref:Uncharacterized protein n=1 Tax=Caenorhabditis elegans TaxID=6239 RepID=Q22954_CAEEL|nr:Uncharacterized protein CELE_F10G2.4 [Caenorhabditis elegans]CCD62812.1 Uncharacterized protein CELE_F10G2.4 [Caenorhabditis elegans]|eukprot:NP_504864.1 Uncharacterized protein CELE_F10G2.4 [Caenorhabditis elegans]